MQTLQRTGVDLYVHSNGITLCYDDFGEGTVLVIFIHGFPFEKSSWHSQMGFFQKTDRVLAYDIRGFGKSTIGPERSSINLFADDLIHFMNALNIKKSIICGLSIGGYIAMNAVCRYPGRFKAIILSDTQCIADSNEMKEQRKETVLNITANGLNYFSDEYIKNAFCKETLETKKELVMEVKR